MTTEHPPSAHASRHSRWASLGLVAIGGAVGTLARYLVTTAVPAWQGIDVITFGINVAGALGLGVLLESLLRPGGDGGRGRVIRLLVGAGFFGGFTTYSTFAHDTVALVAQGRPWIAAGYAVATVVAGGLTAALGIALARRLRSRHTGLPR